MKKAISLIIAAVLIAACFTVQAGALPHINYYDYGDVDYDTYVTVVDATFIQRYEINACEFDVVQTIAADYDHDDVISVVDATFIQRKATRIKVPDSCGGIFTDYTKVTNFYADYDSGKAITGVPVTFTAEARSGNKVTGYNYRVKKYNDTIYPDVIFRLSSVEDHFSYTFEEAGLYEISVSCDDMFGNIYGASAELYAFEVVEPYSLDKPVIVSCHNESTVNASDLFTVRAIGGSAPYNYIFRIELTGKRIESSDIEGIDLYDFRIEDDPDTGFQYLIQDKPGTDTTRIPVDFMRFYESYNKWGMFFGCDFTVTAIDADGAVSETETYFYSDTSLEG